MAPRKNLLTNGTLPQDLIPQKKPLVMVDSLFRFSEKQITSGFTIKKDNIFVSDNHFAATGLIENMAQTVALHTGYKYHLLNKPAPTGYIGAIKSALILGLPRVSEQLVTTVKILHDIMGVTLVTARVECNGSLIASSEMKTVLAD
jgi:predicted hotdog family 3-hydroxylacyl-ACP dehydratase